MGNPRASARRVDLVLPADLLARLDAERGAENRSSFVARMLRERYHSDDFDAGEGEDWGAADGKEDPWD